MSTIQYPYLPKGREILYVPENNKYMNLARAYAEAFSLDKVMPGCAVLVKEGDFIGIGTNGSNYHEEHQCQRVLKGCKSGEGYDLCPGCHPDNHSERRAINLALAQMGDTQKSDLYLWGHWWLCRDCWDYVIKFGIKNVYLLERSHILFDKNHPENIVGRQFKV